MTPSLLVEIHRQQLVNTMRSTFIIINRSQIDNRVLIARIGLCGDDIMVVIPSSFGRVRPILIIERQERVLVIQDIGIGELCGSSFYSDILLIEKSLHQIFINILSGFTLLLSGRLDFQTDAAFRRKFFV